MSRHEITSYGFIILNNSSKQYNNDLTAMDIFKKNNITVKTHFKTLILSPFWQNNAQDVY